MTSFKLSLAALSVLCAVAAMPAAQAQDGQTNHRTVRLAGLDLTTTAGQAQLRRRVHQAAEAVCGPTDPAAMITDAGYASCMSTAEGAALAKADTMIAEAGRSARPAVVAFN